MDSFFEYFEHLHAVVMPHPEDVEGRVAVDDPHSVVFEGHGLFHVLGVGIPNLDGLVFGG